MIAIVKSTALSGLDGQIVEVEVDVSRGFAQLRNRQPIFQTQKARLITGEPVVIYEKRHLHYC